MKSQVRLASSCGLGLAGLVLATAAQAAAPVAGNGVPGYLNPSTGSFTPAPRRVDAVSAESALAAAVTVTGTLSYKMTITIKSGLSTASPILCTGQATITDGDFTSNTFYSETKTVPATRSGTTATCTVSIPYSWLLSDFGSSQVSMSYVVSHSLASGDTQRLHQGTLPVIAVPASGTTTTRNIAVTL